ncbi:hypothetical protein JTE90_026760 [Oedothorax gibbosus]|uniref:Uncharacterized protein n=1 Tax=Oedothorax gibbosus TaxID=931172 RepID=A0AAV6UZG0_9ARAC|nr:hypothetical protein JTE90_026760 [Oedothorax gibbosus]
MIPITSRDAVVTERRNKRSDSCFDGHWTSIESGLGLKVIEEEKRAKDSGGAYQPLLCPRYRISIGTPLAPIADFSKKILTTDILSIVSPGNDAV